MVAVAFGKRKLAGGWSLYLLPGRHSSPADKKGAGNIVCRENSFIYTKEASRLCMDIYMHVFPARFIFFINMLIQVQALQNTNMDMRGHII